MGFFFRDFNDSGGPDRQDRITAESLPSAADARLTELGACGLFTSTLSVNELALLTDLGPQPVAQLLGASVYKVGWQYLPPDAQFSGSDLLWQLDTVSEAWNRARSRAFDRLREEARLVGADAVVGVRLSRGQHDWASHSVDFMVSGTGIRMPDADPDAPAAPLLSDLSVQDYWKLTRAGWSPAGLVAATSALFISQGFRTRMRRRLAILNNQELIEFSDGFAAAREAVVADLRGQARSAKADGVVGVSFQYEFQRAQFAVTPIRQRASGISPVTMGIGGDMRIRGADKRSGLVVTVHAVGTAIRRSGTGNAAPPSTLVNQGGAR